MARVLHHRDGDPVSVLFDGRRASRWLVEGHGWVIVLHLAAAVWHHFIKRDRVAARTVDGAAG